MSEFAYLDESLDINQTQSYHLSIQLGLNGLSFCILDTVTSKYLALRHYPVPDGEEEEKYLNAIRKITEKDDMLQQPFKSSAIIAESFKSTLVPAPLYRKEEKKAYFSFNHTLEKGEDVYADKLNGPDAYCLYALNKDLEDLLSSTFRDAKLFHHSKPFIENLFRNSSGKGKEAFVHILIHDTYFDVAVIQEQKLLVYNTFLYRQVNDMIYFILYLLEMLKLDQKNVQVILEGKINVQSSVLETLKRYIRHVTLSRRNTAYTYSYKLNSLPAHTFANLFNVHLCV